MPAAERLKSRYELKTVLKEGGMGVVYRAFDSSTGRDVALKTIREFQDRAALELFRKECDTQKSLHHPNIVDLYDIGELDMEGKLRPYFVMPLLRGASLDELIHESADELSVERAVDIICQTCRGLQAAHDHGLVHRDLKPSNIFVLEDFSVKIIDFGVAHLVDQRSSLGLKGTLLYMAPEQIQLKRPTPQSDIFSLGVVCYEALTRRRPFEGARKEEIAEKILRHIPVPASELNPGVSPALAQVVHAAMAKEPYHRFGSARELAETLQKALRGEPIERFNPARIQPRLERARKAFEQGEFEFAAEILSALESESYIHPDITALRRKVEQASKEKTIRQLLESSRRRFEDEEYQLALQKLQEVLELEPGHADALGLKAGIESKRSAQQIDEWFLLAQQHIDNHAYDHARQALQNVLELTPNNSRAMQMIADVSQRQHEFQRMRQQKQQLYQAALDDWEKGEVSSALSKLERVLELDRKWPEAATASGDAHEQFYNRVRSAVDAMKNAYGEARRQLDTGDFRGALALCDEYLEKYPGHALFQALKFDVQERQRQELSAFIARVDREVETEPDLERRVSILQAALERFPDEHLGQLLRLTTQKRDLVNSIVAKARHLEERGQFTEALSQWEMLRTIYRQYPGLDFEVERVIRRKEQQARIEAKSRCVEQIDECIGEGAFRRALSLVQAALAEFPGDGELAALEQLATSGVESEAEAQRLLVEGQQLCAAGRTEEGMEVLRRAHQLDPRSAAVRATLVEALLAEARALLQKDWRSAEALIDEALGLDPNNPLAKGLRGMAVDLKDTEAIDQCLRRARTLQASGNLVAAIAEVEPLLAVYPQDSRLLQLRNTLNRALLSQRLSPARQRDRDLEAVRELRREYEEAADQGQRTMTVERSQVLAKQYADDPEFQSVFRDFDTFLKTHAREPEKPAPQPPAPEPPAPPPQAFRRSNAGDSIRAVVGQGGAMLAGLRRVRIPRPGVPVPIRGAAKQVAASVRAKPLHWAAGGVVALAIGVGIVFVVFPPKPPLPPPPPRYAVRIETRPAGAAVLLDGQPYDIAKPPALLAGTHRLEAFLDGYERNVQDIRVAPGSQGPYVIQLQPLPTALRISSDLGDDAIAIDGEKVKLEGGEFSADQLAPGPHTLAVSAARYGSLTMTTEVRTGEAPVAAEAPPARELRVLLVSSFRGSARVVANFAPVQLAVDSRPPEELPAAGLTVDNLSPGSHDFSFGEGAEQFKISIDIGAAPSLFASVRTYRTTGDLRIVLAGNGVRIFLDNGERKLKGQRLNDGRFVYAIPSLPPKSYQVRVEKDGFQTQSQSIEVTKGGVAKLDFNLVAIPKPRLEIVGTPRTKVVVAGTSHQTDAAGNLSIEVEPGEHSIELSREGHRPKTLTRNFEAGKRVQLSSGDVVLEKIEVLGKLVVTVSPGGARVTLLQGDREVILTPGSELALQPGSYTVRASAQGHIAQTRTVEVAANKTFPLEIKLAPEPPKPPLVLGMDGFVDAAGWRLEDKWYVRRGGGRVAFRPSLTLGSFRFSLLRKTGLLGRWSGVRWFFRYGARGEYVQFRIDKGTFYCRINSGDEKKLASYRTDQDVLPIDIQVYGDRIEHQVFDGKTWEVIGVWKIPGGDIARGQFGFLIGNDEEVWLTSFKFQAAR